MRESVDAAQADLFENLAVAATREPVVAQPVQAEEQESARRDRGQQARREQRRLGLLAARLPLPPVPAHPERFRWRDIVLLRDMRRGLGHVRSLGLTPVLFAKSFWGPAGGYLVLLSIAGARRFGVVAEEVTAADPEAVARRAAFATGALLCARGVGTGVGPILARRYHGSGDRQLRHQITAGFLIGAAGYAFFGTAGLLPLAFLWVVLAHMGGSALWVASTTYWQRRIDDAFRGRVFALEFLSMNLSFSIGGLIAGVIYDRTGSIEIATWSICALVVILGVCWTVLARGMPVKDEPAPRPDPLAEDPR